MDKAFLEKIDQAQKAKIAVAYLLKNKEDRPEGLEKLFSKLEKYEISMREVMSAIKQTQKSLEELTTKGDQMLGSVESIAELIADELPHDKIEEWTAKYELPENIRPDAHLAGRAPIKKAGPVDMAGSTAKFSQNLATSEHA